jgi:hypothetical protein
MKPGLSLSDLEYRCGLGLVPVLRVGESLTQVARCAKGRCHNLGAVSAFINSGGLWLAKVDKRGLQSSIPDMAAGRVASKHVIEGLDFDRGPVPFERPPTKEVAPKAASQPVSPLRKSHENLQR